MREIIASRLWIGHAGDARNEAALRESGVAAVVDLALEELPAKLSRDLIYCRIPLLDGAENSPGHLRAAVDTVRVLLLAGVPTLVACGGGMSRSPAIAAAAVHAIEGASLDDCLARVASLGPHDVSPGLWEAIKSLSVDPG